MSSTPLLPSENSFLRAAAEYLDNPSLLMGLANFAGRPLEKLAQYVVPRQVAEIGEAALRHAMTLAAYPLGAAPLVARERDLTAAYEAAGWTGFWHKLAVAGTGGGGGFFGLPALAVELPVTTGILLRSIASIASDFGEDVRTPAVRLECLSVFSYGNSPAADDAMESSYLTARLAIAKLIENAAQFVARESAEAVAEAMARGAAPALLNFIGRVAVQFDVAVSEKFLVQGLPVLGGFAGAAINVAFADHFNTVARYHFGIRKLERRVGADAVQTAYQAEVLRIRRPDPKA